MGVCADIVNTPLAVWVTHAGVQGATYGALYLYYAKLKAQADDGKTTGMLVFPVYMRIIALSGVAALLRGLASIGLLFIQHPYNLWALLSALAIGFDMALVHGTTVLLCQPGCGERAMRIARCWALVTGLITAAVWVWLLSTVSINFVSRSQVGEISFIIWQAILFLCYLWNWVVAPNVIFRRPAARYFSRFWCFYFLVACIAITLVFLGVDSGLCLFHLNLAGTCTIVKVYVYFQTLAIDSSWWQGDFVQLPIEDRTMSAGKKWCCPESFLRFKWFNTRYSNESMRESLTMGQQRQISEPVDGLTWNAGTAAEVANQMDEFGPVRGSSLVHADLEEMKKDEKQSRGYRFSKSGGRAGQLFRRASRVGSEVPLLNFSKLALIENKMLGSGSSARVYEGRWCGKKCAVKMLFLVDVTPMDVSRACQEAALLHSLASTHVVRLYGVCVLPPSLCVVLELCNAGSLHDVLYNRPTQSRLEVKEKGKTASSISSALSAMSLSSFGSLRSVENLRTVLGGPEGISWEDRLELAEGCARAVAALHDALPGYSHNDIKSANFLVHVVEKKYGTQPELQVKLADVEFAAIGAKMNPEIGFTPNWTAPEVLGGEHPATPESDSFSLGMVLYEITAIRVPFGKERPESVKNKYMSGVRPSLRPRLDSGPGHASILNADADAGEAREILSSNSQGDEDFPELPPPREAGHMLANLIDSLWNQEPEKRTYPDEAGNILHMLREIHAEYRPCVNSERKSGRASANTVSSGQRPSDKEASVRLSQRSSRSTIEMSSSYSTPKPLK